MAKIKTKRERVKFASDNVATLSEANLTRSLFVLIFAIIIVLESNLSVRLLGKHPQYNNVNLHQKRRHL